MSAVLAPLEPFQWFRRRKLSRIRVLTASALPHQGTAAWPRKTKFCITETRSSDREDLGLKPGAVQGRRSPMASRPRPIEDFKKGRLLRSAVAFRILKALRAFDNGSCSFLPDFRRRRPPIEFAIT